MEKILEILSLGGGTETIAAIVDFAVVYFVIYRMLLLIKGTRAVQVASGLIAVILIFFLSELLGLTTTHWFIDKFIANFILVVVIIFQDDVRRALAQFGRTSNYFQSAKSIEDTQAIEEIIKAAVMLSNKKTGALIAIQRQADLTHMTEDAIKVDAVVSKDVLFSIFLTSHQNPLHDGAVIIQSGRISAAGCFLPLTNNPKVEKTLGTRHRAAIGLSESTDAAVVIVSEETGIISIAYKEELFRRCDANEMREMLQRIFSTETDDEARSLLEKFGRKRKTNGSNK